MIVTQVLSDNGVDNDSGVLDLSVKKRSASNDGVSIKSNKKLPLSGQLSVLLSPPSSTTSSSSSSSSSMVSPKRQVPGTKRMLDLCTASTLPTTTTTTTTSQPISASKRPLRFQCKHCDYKAPSTSLMQNHIYRHTDLTPYACAYCGHKSTTKSTIMVHIELCHPNMEVKIIENRVREQDFYRDLNSSEISTPLPTITAVSTLPPAKKARRSNGHSQQQYDSESAPINGVAISLKPMFDDGRESSPASISDDASETENLEPILLQTADHLFDEDDPPMDGNLFNPSSAIGKTLKMNFSSYQQPPIVDSSTTETKETDSDDGGEYLLVYNRPKQYYGSLYEPDKQYACKLCSYTTNHRPSMEDHVFVHTNEKPYKCGYCGEEIYTRYAATYHIKYKHTGMERNFIQNKADVTQYYINRAKKEDEKNQFKVIDTRRVRIPTRNGKSVINHQYKMELTPEPTVQLTPSPSPSIAPTPPPPPPPPPTQASKPSTSVLPPTTPLSANNLPAGVDYRLLFAWSYYMASQAAWLSPMFQQQQQQQQRDLSSPALPTDPDAAAKFFQQAMQAAMGPLASMPAAPASDNHDEEQIDNESESSSNTAALFVIKEEASES